MWSETFFNQLQNLPLYACYLPRASTWLSAALNGTHAVQMPGERLVAAALPGRAVAELHQVLVALWSGQARLCVFGQ